jgi:hypothetical protein
MRTVDHRSALRVFSKATLKKPKFVIPAKAGIQPFQWLGEELDSGFRRNDDFFSVALTVA